VFSASCAFADVDRDGDGRSLVVNYVDARIDNNIYCGDTSKKIRIYCHPLNFQRFRACSIATTATARSPMSAGKPGSHSSVATAWASSPATTTTMDGWTSSWRTTRRPIFLYHNEGKGVFRRWRSSRASPSPPTGDLGPGHGHRFRRLRRGRGPRPLRHQPRLEAHTLFRNLGKGLFEDATFTSGVGPPTLPFVGFGAEFLDVDNDSDLDLSIVNGHVMNSASHFRPGAKEAQRNLLLRNGGNGRFTDVSRQSGPGFALENVSRTLASADIDNDGDLDLLVTNNNSSADLLRNGGTRGTTPFSYDSSAHGATETRSERASA